MITVELLERVPENFTAFTNEISEGVAALHGPRAAQLYLKTARRNFAAGLQQPSMATLAARASGTAVGLLMASARGDSAEISFLHVLAPWTRRGVEAALVSEAIRMYRNAGLSGILCELVSFCPLEIAGTLTALEFERVERELMAAPVEALARLPEGPYAPEPYDDEQCIEAAACIVDAYRGGHPGRWLHPEVADTVKAAEFLVRAATGNYGPRHAGYIQCIWNRAGCAGVGVGCESAPGMGFVLQLAVRRSEQGHGAGTALLGALGRRFAETGLSRAGLGVTTANPARRLYERLGFKRLRQVESFVWWHPDVRGRE